MALFPWGVDITAILEVVSSRGSEWWREWGEVGGGGGGGWGGKSTDHLRIVLLSVDFVDVRVDWDFWEAGSLERSRAGIDGGERSGSERPGEGQSAGEHLRSVMLGGRVSRGGEGCMCACLSTDLGDD